MRAEKAAERDAPVNREAPAGGVLARIGRWLRGRARRRLDERVVHAQRLQAVGSFAMCVAHELGNMLEVIGANALLIAESADPAIRDAARDLQEAERLARELVRQLLAYGRREEHRPEVLDLAVQVADTSRFLDLALGRTHRIAVEAAEDVPVLTSRGAVGQVVVNLVLNARDAMPRGGTVHVRVWRLPRAVAAALGSDLDAAEQAMLEVEDHGVGIPEETVARVFEPFFTTKAAGTGLGLSVVRDLVARSEGSVQVESTRGRGTRFRVFFPIASLRA
jgi:two-component system cell cycle sensor histidine kinase/response regulator CckA